MAFENQDPFDLWFHKRFIEKENGPENHREVAPGKIERETFEEGEENKHEKNQALIQGVA